MLRVGQKLWWVDHEQQTEGTVIIADIEKNGIWVWYKGKQYFRDYSVLGKKLFFRSQLKVAFPQKTENIEQSIFTSSSAYAYQNDHVPDRSGMFLPEEVKNSETLYRIKSTPGSEKSCDRCALRRNGTCSSLANNLCDDYRPAQHISQEELDTWPEYGDALAYKFRNRNHFKD